MSPKTRKYGRSGEELHLLVTELKKDGVSDEKMDYEIGLKILEMMKETAGNGYGGSITTMVYSSKLNLPLVLALGQLENAEKLLEQKKRDFGVTENMTKVKEVKPEADVLDIKTGKKSEGIETLKEDLGLPPEVNPKTKKRMAYLAILVVFW